MAQKHTLHAEPRARTGSGLLKQMRREGWLPSVLYGKGADNLNLKVDARAFRELMAASASESILINLDVADQGERLAFLQDIQHDPLTGIALHADFRAVDEKTEISAQVPVDLTGEPVGVKSGGILEQMLHAIDIRCPARALPEQFEFDVSALDDGDSLHVGDVSFPDGVVPQYGPEVQIAHIGRPAAVIAEDALETEEAEVIEPEPGSEEAREEAEAEPAES